MRVSIGAALGLLLFAGGSVARGAPAAGGEAELTGRATQGAAERQVTLQSVTLRLACDPAGSGFSATLIVPRFAELAPTFDFDALEGPTGSSSLLTEIRVSGAGGVRSVRARASGAVASDPATSFTLTVAGVRRGEDPLRGIAPAMPEAGARLTWTQASPRKGDAPLVATFPIGDAEAATVRAALSPCLGR